MTSSARVSHKQRDAMFKFMLQHPDFARGRVTGPDAAVKRANLIKEMASLLNTIGMGATKTPEKWWKCWQDWRCDSKAKAKRIKRFKGGGPGYTPAPAPLTELEENLLQFCGLQVANEEDGTPDPLEHEQEMGDDEEEMEEATLTPIVKVEVEDVPPSQKRARSESDPMEEALARQTEALNRIAGGLESLSDAIRTGFLEVAKALTH